MAWGDQFASPVAALADGTIVVGATRGLMLLSEDGTLRPHPDPAAVGRSSDVVRSARGVFALRSTPEGSEVLAVDAQTVRVLWKDPQNLYSLAALEDRLVLVRVNGTMLEQVTIAAANGAELERQTAMADLPVDYVFARASGGVPYALLVYRNGTVALGSLRMSTFNKLAQGELSIAGPLSVDDVMLLAIDGGLTQWVAGHATPLADSHAVVCLAEHEGIAYACDTEGIARVSGQAVGEPLFRFGWLAAPDLSRITDEEARFLCNSQWQDLRFEVELTGMSLNGESMPVAGGAPVDPSAAGGVGAQTPLAGATGGAAGQVAAGGAGVVPGQPVQSDGTSCSVRPGRSTPPAAAAFVLVFGLALSRRRRSRGR